MKLFPTIITVFIAAAPVSAPVSAHHRQDMFDRSQGLLIEGTVAWFDWESPHMYVIAETKGIDGPMAKFVSVSQRVH